MLLGIAALAAWAATRQPSHFPITKHVQRVAQSASAPTETGGQDKPSPSSSAAANQVAVKQFGHAAANSEQPESWSNWWLVVLGALQLGVFAWQPSPEARKRTRARYPGTKQSSPLGTLGESGLFSYFDIDQADENAWPKLAYRLACTYVPGFQVLSRKDQESPVDPFTVHRLIFDFMHDRPVTRSVRNKPGTTVEDACRFLTTPGEPLEHLSIKTAMRIYSARNKALDKVLEEARAWDHSQYVPGVAAIDGAVAFAWKRILLSLLDEPVRS